MYTSIFLLAAGLFAIICTVLKPIFYWESRKAKRLRNLIGDTTTSALYILIGIVLIGLSITDLLGIISI